MFLRKRQECGLQTARNYADKARSRMIPGAFSYGRVWSEGFALPASAWFPGFAAGHARPPDCKLMVGFIKEPSP